MSYDLFNTGMDKVQYEMESIEELLAFKKEAMEVIEHLGNSQHPYTIHEDRDTLEHRFGLQIEVAREFLAKHGEEK